MSSDNSEPFTYSDAGVDTDAARRGLSGLLSWVSNTRRFRSGLGESILPVGFFASVLRVSPNDFIAISTDGVGSKVVIAQMLDSYKGIGIDCVAVNVNDVLCVGADPIAIVDYISVETPNEFLLESIGQGLHDGAEKSGIAIVGGELSQHPDTLVGPVPGKAFDISGTCIGLLSGREPIIGGAIVPGDVIIGLPSAGIHSNGLTLARHSLIGTNQRAVHRYLPDCGLTVGEELLRPTEIYVKEVATVLGAGINVKGLAHISGDGLLNLTRLNSNVSYRIDSLLPIPPIFQVIQSEGAVNQAEMFRVFNMGIGFCIVVAEEDVDRTMDIIRNVQCDGEVIGSVVHGEERTVHIEEHHLMGHDGHFWSL